MIKANSVKCWVSTARRKARLNDEKDFFFVELESWEIGNTAVSGVTCGLLQFQIDKFFSPFLLMDVSHWIGQVFTLFPPPLSIRPFKLLFSILNCQFCSFCARPLVLEATSTVIPRFDLVNRHGKKEQLAPPRSSDKPSPSQPLIGAIDLSCSRLPYTVNKVQLFLPFWDSFFVFDIRFLAAYLLARIHSLYRMYGCTNEG